MITNPELTAARAAVPEIADAERRLQAAEKLLDGAPTTVEPHAARNAVLDEAADAFMADKPWPKDVGKRAAKAFEDAEATELEFLARKGAVTRAEWALYEALDAGTEDVLSALGARLSELLDEARSDFTALRGANSAEAAIEAGGDAVAAWSRLRGIVQSVGHVRASQWEVLRGPTAPGEGMRGDWHGRNWRLQGFGHVQRTHPDEVPDAVRAVMRDVSGRVDMGYVRWLVAQEDAYVPASVDALEGDIAVLTVPAGMEDWPDISPRELPTRPGRPGDVYAHSRAAHLDISQPAPPKPKPTAAHPDGEPTTRDYF
ncbi:hypothetical protein [Streptomyces fuscichromogenes]|uniref:Uncharacterized protein n=1 Tax=Streptomyces fuscichromogenes TaxID=1324013 RepID=A0A918CW57_9ACTN|nr:hypothetical protein [Streptomyces fuscichromogenes]GGN38156.1 hypothetical protein GCM10011578_083240 [Streptomyces fuscichromogenes]